MIVETKTRPESYASHFPDVIINVSETEIHVGQWHVKLHLKKKKVLNSIIILFETSLKLFTSLEKTDLECGQNQGAIRNSC